ncbi:MAG: DNA-3-methyladenine glycosylase 2 family protein [Hyphomicrobiales bacterium]|nr:DNA-3-methyladenine glycosylase 2 family protein [Hyphomicrobiales bacterium]
MVITPPYWQEACTTLSAADPVMEQLIMAYQGETLQSRGCGFTTLVRSIVGQQVSVQAADAIWSRVMEALNGDISHATLLAIDPEALRACGLSRQKVAYVKDIAMRTKSGALDFEALTTLPDAEAINMLTAVKGIGTWTAEMFLIFHALRPDIFPVADLGLQKAIRKHYLNEEKSPPPQGERVNKTGTSPSPSSYSSPLKGEDIIAACHQISEYWRPWRTVATWYLWRSLDPVPVEY